MLLKQLFPASFISEKYFERKKYFVRAKRIFILLFCSKKIYGFTDIVNFSLKMEDSNVSEIEFESDAEYDGGIDFSEESDADISDPETIITDDSDPESDYDGDDHKIKGIIVEGGGPWEAEGGPWEAEPIEDFPITEFEAEEQVSLPSEMTEASCFRSFLTDDVINMYIIFLSIC